MELPIVHRKTEGKICLTQSLMRREVFQLGETGNWHVWSGKVHPTSLLMGETFSSLAKVSSSIPPSEERWMRMAAVELGGGEIALFMDDPVTVWKSDLAALDQYDGPIAEYPIPNNRNTGRAIFLDRESSTWFFYFRTGDWCNHTCDGHQIRLWTAPARLSDTESIPPRPPENLRAD